DGAVLDPPLAPDLAVAVDIAAHAEDLRTCFTIVDDRDDVAASFCRIPAGELHLPIADDVAHERGCRAIVVAELPVLLLVLLRLPDQVVTAPQDPRAGLDNRIVREQRGELLRRAKIMHDAVTVHQLHDEEPVLDGARGYRRGRRGQQQAGRQAGQPAHCPNLTSTVTPYTRGGSR